MPNPNLGREMKRHNRKSDDGEIDCDNDGFEKKPKPLSFNNDYKLPFFCIWDI